MLTKFDRVNEYYKTLSETDQQKFIRENWKSIRELWEEDKAERAKSAPDPEHLESDPGGKAPEADHSHDSGASARKGLKQFAAGL